MCYKLSHKIKSNRKLFIKVFDNLNFNVFNRVCAFNVYKFKSNFYFL